MIKKTSCRWLIALTFKALCITLSAQLLFMRPNPIQCSSYLDDYFLPTAKLALNKLQQSLSPGSQPNGQPIEASTSLAQVADNVTAPSGSFSQAAPSTTITTTADIISVNDLQRRQSQDNNLNEQTQRASDGLPIKTDFVKLDTQFELAAQSQPKSAQPSSTEVNSSPVTTLSSTLASNEDPTTLTAFSGDEFNLNADATSANSEQANVIKLESASNLNKEDTTTTATTTTSTTTTTPEVRLVEALDSDTKVTSDGTTKLTGTKSQDAASQEPAIVTIASDTNSGSDNNINGINNIKIDSNNYIDRERQPLTGNTIVIESKSADDAAIRETELDAVAAVDASIGFGADLFASMSDPCYDEYGNARYCEPEFENAAFERQVEVSSECGSPPSRFCTAYLNEHNDQIRNCHICDSQHPKKRHPAAYLTDLNNSNNPTCWVSAPINAPSNNNSNIDQQVDNTSSSSSQITKSDNVTLILNLDKKYEIIYISMQFCSIKPDSLAIFKSMDYGQTWLPYQYYSSQCRRMYGRPASKSSPSSGTTGPPPTRSSSSSSSSHVSPKASAPGVEQYLEPSCMNSSQTSGGGQPNSGRIAFSPLGEGRASSGALSVEKSPVLQDWITATNIKIVLDRHQANWIHSNLVHAHHHSASLANNNSATNNNKLSNTIDTKLPEQQQQQLAASNELENSLTSPSNTFNYAMSDLTVGGRCKCNGHASRCIHSKEGKLQCDCRHNTAGRDCEKCATLHYDRPWARATQSDANPCQREYSQTLSLSLPLPLPLPVPLSHTHILLL